MNHDWIVDEIEKLESLVLEPRSDVLEKVREKMLLLLREIKRLQEEVAALKGVNP